MNVVIGLVVGGVLVWLILRTKISTISTRLTISEQAGRKLEGDLADQRTKNALISNELATVKARLESESQAAAEKLAIMTSARQELENTFHALAAKVLKDNNQSFLQLAKTQLADFQNQAEGDLQARQKAVEEIVKPITESLNKVDAKLGHVEAERISAYASLGTQVESLISAQMELR
ncbi:MAG: DNA recombination protein RmuC, partial [Acidobacteria bacterium]